jgi:hypothetical protein
MWYRQAVYRSICELDWMRFGVQERSGIIYTAGGRIANDHGVITIVETMVDFNAIT